MDNVVKKDWEIIEWPDLDTDELESESYRDTVTKARFSFIISKNQNLNPPFSLRMELDYIDKKKLPHIIGITICMISTFEKKDYYYYSHGYHSFSEYPESFEIVFPSMSFVKNEKNINLFERIWKKNTIHLYFQVKRWDSTPYSLKMLTINDSPCFSRLLLENEFSTCYLNAIISILYNIPEFRDIIFKVPESNYTISNKDDKPKFEIFEDSDKSNEFRLLRTKSTPIDNMSVQKNKHIRKKGIKCVRSCSLRFNINYNQIPREKIVFPIIQALQRLFAMMNQECKCSTRVLTDSFGWPLKALKIQHDAHEFYYRFLDKLREKLPHSLEQDLVNLFYGVERVYTITKPINGDEETEKSDQPFNSIEITNISQCNSLDYGLKSYFQDCYLNTEDPTIEYKIKKNRLFRLPKILSIHICRFDKLYKDFSLFRYTRYINLLNYMVNSNNEEEMNPTDYMYKLFAVVVHRGSTNSGHYYSYISPSVEDKWVKFDGQISNIVSNKDEVFSYNFGTPDRTNSNCPTAYMLLYVRLDSIEEVMGMNPPLKPSTTAEEYANKVLKEVQRESVTNEERPKLITIINDEGLKNALESGTSINFKNVKPWRSFLLSSRTNLKQVFRLVKEAYKKDIERKNSNNDDYDDDIMFENYLSNSLIYALNENGITQPTLIQARTIKPILNGNDVFVSAIPGSGKSDAFLIPIIHKMSKDQKVSGPNALIMSSDLSSSNQLHSKFNEFAKYSNLNSILLNDSITEEDLNEKISHQQSYVIFTTPGLKINDKLFTIVKIKYFIIHEADSLLDKNDYENELIKISLKLPEDHQTLISSSKINDKTDQFCNKVLKKDAVKISLDTFEHNLDQKFYLWKCGVDRYPKYFVVCDDEKTEIKSFSSLESCLYIDFYSEFGPASLVSGNFEYNFFVFFDPFECIKEHTMLNRFKLIKCIKYDKNKIIGALSDQITERLKEMNLVPQNDQLNLYYFKDDGNNKFVEIKSDKSFLENKILFPSFIYVQAFTNKIEPDFSLPSTIPNYLNSLNSKNTDETDSVSENEKQGTEVSLFKTMGNENDKMYKFPLSIANIFSLFNDSLRFNVFGFGYMNPDHFYSIRVPSQMQIVDFKRYLAKVLGDEFDTVSGNDVVQIFRAPRLKTPLIISVQNTSNQTIEIRNILGNRSQKSNEIVSNSSCFIDLSLSLSEDDEDDKNIDLIEDIYVQIDHHFKQDYFFKRVSFSIDGIFPTFTFHVMVPQKMCTIEDLFNNIVSPKLASIVMNKEDKEYDKPDYQFIRQLIESQPGNENGKLIYDSNLIRTLRIQNSIITYHNWNIKSKISKNDPKRQEIRFEIIPKEQKASSLISVALAAPLETNYAIGAGHPFMMSVDGTEEEIKERVDNLLEKILMPEEIRSKEIIIKFAFGKSSGEIVPNSKIRPLNQNLTDPTKSSSVIELNAVDIEPISQFENSEKEIINLIKDAQKQNYILFIIIKGLNPNDFFSVDEFFHDLKILN